MPDNMVNFGPLTAEIGRQFGAALQISTGFASWQRYCTESSSGRQPNFAALNRGRHLCSAGRPSGWALAHILVTGSIASSASRPYLIYSEADFEVFFAPQGRHVALMGVKLGTE